MREVVGEEENVMEKEIGRINANAMILCRYGALKRDDVQYGS